MKLYVNYLLVLIFIPLHTMDLLHKVEVQANKRVTIQVVQENNDIQDSQKIRKSISIQEITKYSPTIRKKNKNQQPLLLAQKESEKLCSAIKANNPDKVRIALQEGAALNFQNKNEGKTFLMLAIENIQKYIKNKEINNHIEFQKGVEILKLLFSKEKRQDMFLTDNKGKDVLDYAEKFDMKNLASIITFLQTFQATDFDKIRSTTIQVQE